jgi:hypothetical protein
MDNCYRPGPESDSEALRREFGPQPFDAWLARLTDCGLLQILVAVSLKLDRLACARLEGSRREAVLQRLAELVHDVVESLPREAVATGHPQSAEPRLTLEQLLICRLARNLKRLLEVLDRSGGGGIVQRDATRRWVVQELFYCLRRQIETAAMRGWSWPRQTWLELHDLHVYSRARVDGRAEPLDRERRFDADGLYKQLLLIGLIAEQGTSELLDPARRERFAEWVAEAQLKEPGAYIAELGVWLVECSRDLPPRRVPGPLGTVNRAWVFDLPPGLASEIDAIRTDRNRGGTSAT